MQMTQSGQAALLALAASAILSFIDNFVAAVSAEAGLWQFQLFRAAFALPLLIVAARLMGKSFRVVHFGRIAMRSIVVSIGPLIFFASLGALPVSQAGAGLFSAPLWVALLSVILFRQQIGRVIAFAVVLGFAGALTLLQPDVRNLTLLSVMPLAAGLFYGLGMMLTRHRCADDSAMSLAIVIFLTIGIVSLVMLFWVTAHPGSTFMSTPWARPTALFLWLTFLQAVGAVFAVTLIAQAYRIGNSTMVSAYEYSFLIFASIWAFVLWGATTDALAWVGIIVVVASGILMAQSEKRTSDAATSL